MTTTSPDPLRSAIAAEASDLTRLVADVTLAASDDDATTRQRAETLVLLGDVRERLEALHDRLTGAAVAFCPDGAA